MRNFRNLLVSLLVLVSLASATTFDVSYTSLAAWQAATTGRTNIDFDSIDLGQDNYEAYTTSPGLTGLASGLDFTGVMGSNSYLLYASLDNTWGTSQLLRLDYSNSAYLLINVPTATSAFSINLISVSPGAGNLKIQVDNTDVATVSTQSGTPKFFGLTTNDGTVSQIKIFFDDPTFNGASMAMFDNFAFGAYSSGSGGGGGGEGGETPEVATMLCVGSGLMTLRLMRRRSTSANATAAA